MRRHWLHIISITLVVSILSLMTIGCSSETPVQGMKGTLKIAVRDKGTYEYLYQDYIDAAYPDLKVELVEMETDQYHNTTIEEFKKKLEREKPDLILCDIWRFNTLVNEDVFMDIADKMYQSGMKEDDFYPGMIDWLKQDGGGKLYALAQNFQSAFLYYNEDLFKKAGVEFPQDGMTLEEVYKLASRFKSGGSSKDRIVGFHQSFSNLPYNVLEDFQRSEGIRMVDLRSGKVSIDTPSWHHIVESVVNLYQFGTLSLKEIKPKVINGVQTYDQEASEQADLFGQGKAAMTISYYNEHNNYKFKWGAVLPPVSSTQRNRSANIYVFDVMAIRSGSTNSEMAWKIIELMTSDHIAKVSSKLGTVSGFSSKKSYLNYSQNQLVNKVFDLLPIHTPYFSNDKYDETIFYKSFQDIINSEVAAAVKGEKSVDQIIAAIQKEGQALLDAAKIKK
ncbi:hypothetical protein Back11_32770 [Paenibacillus baekrokdamisoli]|uniref:Uncharacterized protein n=1 Tax=Paenibacillus baekrokdamisoli TaxID=1712516 RepID=A0A3G9IUJ5_9BACL|nr:ABC transporter substrate-binding protein [Paenibacillus baekrokdamisoli]MBB3071556.1 multiple sugar transport system substrate-binding protein [Paenibacillus baekrokdamisoli]BBH21932.1 hypothetical protein Back11_32770 [Paenibacillus baekrokdamisoli]